MSYHKINFLLDLGCLQAVKNAVARLVTGVQ